MAKVSQFENHIRHTEMKSFLASLGEGDVQRLLGQVEHFTSKEAEHRDRIVLNDFGKEGLEQIVNIAAHGITSHQHCQTPQVLDVGAGIGTFTVPVVSRVKQILPDAAFYAMDLTPAMLKILARRTAQVVPFIGIAENIPGSIKHARAHLKGP